MTPTQAKNAAVLFGDTQAWQTKIYLKRLVMNVLIDANTGYFRKDFKEWLEKNWNVWLAFEREASKLWDLGRRHGSARRIGEWLRHDTETREIPVEGDWKINNNIFPDLGRLYMLVHCREGFFETRVCPLSVRAA